MKALAIGLAIVVALAGATALAGDRQPNGLKHIGLKAYWSLLSADQKEEAKVIIAEHLAATAPDRLEALSKMVAFKGEVAAVLTPEQRLAAGKIRWVMKRLPREKKAAILDGLLNDTDRAGLADRVESLDSAAPVDRVRIGLEIIDQMYEVMEPKLAEKLGLTAEQRERIHALYGQLKTDLEPVAVRLAEAKATATRKGLSILDEDQRAKLETVKETVLTKVLDFIRG